MKRKVFLKKATLGGLLASIAPSVVKASSTNTSTYDKLLEQVGFNHLPNNENMAKNSVLHKAETRGHADHGWLNSHHSFSFANYMNPERMNFGVLRVLNDDIVHPGKGFSTHPHDNMEIISIPLKGDLEHKDSMGNAAVIKEGDVQVMSAGTGVFHSEYNKNTDKDVQFLQIWLFPNKRDVQPRYDQISIEDVRKKNELYQILSPNEDDQGVWINQNAWFHMGEFDAGAEATYHLKSKGNGVYAFVLHGNVTLNGQELNKRDGFGVWEVDTLNMSASSDAQVLLMEVPMEI